MQHFMRDSDYYKRDYDLIRSYVDDIALYIHQMTGKPLEQCREFTVAKISPGGEHALKIPNVLVLQRDRKTGDRKKVEIPFDEFLADVRRNREILSPSMAAYVHPEVDESLLAKYIIGNLGKRKKSKGEYFVAKMAGNEMLAEIKNGEQSSYKLKNNSLSGAQVSPYQILWNKSAHSTLTSGCRVATSYGNANNEKFLYGNRHYFAPDVVKTNIISIINNSDYELIAKVMAKFDLKDPSVDDVMRSIDRSTSPYWRNDNQMAIIKTLVQSLKPIQRSAFLFTSDFYYTAEVNPEFTRTFLQRISTKATVPILDRDLADAKIKAMDDNMVAFVSMLCARELDGNKISDVKDMPERYGIIAATAQNVLDTLDHYHDFILAFWVTDNLPSSVFHLPHIVRRSAVTSDTDSTIFTVQHWTQWYRGGLDFSDESLAIGATMVYFAGQLIRHILARASANMGVPAKHLTRLSMKNEFYFPVFALTSRAKHYYAFISAQEGNVYKPENIEVEIKGVALRNSNVPKEIMSKARLLIRTLMEKVMAGEKIKLAQVLRYIALIENGIRTDLEAGNYGLLPKMQIKGAASYKNPESSNYIHYGMWEEVFADKYGHAPAPPYRAIKVSIDAGNPTKLRNWLASFQDRVIASRLEAWLNRVGRKALTTLLLPEPVLQVTGLPKEIIAGLQIRNLQAETMEAFYLILESIGYFTKTDNITRLVSDQAWLLAEDWTQGDLITTTNDKVIVLDDEDEVVDDDADAEEDVTV